MHVVSPQPEKTDHQNLFYENIFLIEILRVTSSKAGASTEYLK